MATEKATTKNTKNTKKPTKVATFAAMVRRIKRDNTKFEAASAQEKRVMVAKDVLALIKIKKIQPTSGVYCEFKQPVFPADLGIKAHVEEDDTTATSLRKAISKTDFGEVVKAAPSCTVCGIGAVFLATVLRKDQLPLSKVLGDDAWSAYDFQDSGLEEVGDDLMRGYLKQAGFTSSMLQILETTFERSDFMGRGGLTGRMASVVEYLQSTNYAGGGASRPLGDRGVVNSSDTAVLEWIMNGVIRDKGEFTPWKDPGYLEWKAGASARATASETDNSADVVW